MIKLSVLDQSPIHEGGTPQEAIRETLALAEAADRLGYARYWLAEHHNTSGLASASPEIMVGQVAARTSRIRVGSGGVMLTHYSPLKVAETFRLLETIYPGRIDLGMGRAPGGDRLVLTALAQGPGTQDVTAYPQQVADVVALLTDDLPQDHPLYGIKAVPAAPSVPDVWLLGSGRESALLAAERGLNFAFAHFFSPTVGQKVVQEYRDKFAPSKMQPKPRVSVAVSVVCAETPQRAEVMALSRQLWSLRAAAHPGASAEELLNMPLSEAETANVKEAQSRGIVGTPESVKERLLALSEEFQTDDLIIVTICHSFEQRLRSYELVARAFGLQSFD